MTRGLENTLSEHYYDPKGARAALGLMKPRFEYLVEIGVIKPANVPGWPFKKKLYVKSYVDMLARTWQAALVANTPAKLELRQAQGQSDLEAELNLLRLVFGKRAASETLRIARQVIYERCPDATWHLYDHGILVALISLIPLSEGAIERIAAGEWWVNLVEHITPFTPGVPLACFLVDFVATPHMGREKRMYYAMRLLSGFSEVCVSWAKQGVDIATVYSVGVNDEGTGLLERSKFAFLGKKEKRNVYRLDIHSSHLHVLHEYNQTIEEWKNAHS